MSLSSMQDSVQATTLPCPICGVASHFDLHVKDAELYRCQACDHRFSDPASLRNTEAYGPEYYEKNWFQNANTKLFEMISKAIAGFKPDASVADVGCGNGAFLKYLHRRNPALSLTGFDLSANDPVDGIDLIQGDVMTMDLSQRFDVVVSLATIEHIADIGGFIGRLKHLARPGGLLIIMTLNDRSVLYACARSLRRLGFCGPSDQLYSSHHVNHFSVTSLRCLIQTNGLTVRKTLLHNIPVAATDISGASPASALIQRIGVWAMFQMGNLTRRTYLQTVVCCNNS